MQDSQSKIKHSSFRWVKFFLYKIWKSHLILSVWELLKISVPLKDNKLWLLVILTVSKLVIVWYVEKSWELWLDVYLHGFHWVSCFFHCSVQFLKCGVQYFSQFYRVSVQYSRLLHNIYFWATSSFQILIYRFFQILFYRYCLSEVIYIVL